MKKILQIVLGVVVLYFIYSTFFDNNCKYPGCKRKGNGWVKCSQAPLKMAAFCSGGAVRYKDSGGYCSKEHAIEAN